MEHRTSLCRRSHMRTNLIQRTTPGFFCSKQKPTSDMSCGARVLALMGSGQGVKECHGWFNLTVHTPCQPAPVDKFEF